LLDWTFKPFWVPEEKRLSYVRAVMVLVGLFLIGLSIFVLLLVGDRAGVETEAASLTA
jgi:hypothetical protein